MRRCHRGKRLEVCIPYKPEESPFQIAECVLESFGPVFLLVEALCDGIGTHSVILNPAKIAHNWRHAESNRRSNIINEACMHYHA